MHRGKRTDYSITDISKRSVWCGDEHYLRITTKRVEEK